MKSTTALLLTILLLLLISCSMDNKEVSLQFRYQEGMSLTYSQDTKGTVAVYENDTIIKSYPDHKWADVTQTVANQINDSTYKIEETVTWHFVQTNKSDTLKMDTISENRTMTLDVLTNGKIVDFTIDEKMASRYSYFKNFYEQGMPVFPEKAVTPGYTWTQTAKVVLPDETMDATTTYEITSIVRESGYDCAVITYQGNLLIPIDEEIEGMKRNGLDQVKSSGKIFFAYKEGIVVKQYENWNLNREVSQTKDDKTESYAVTSDFKTEYILIKKSNL